MGCDVIKAHTCEYHEGSGQGSHSSASQNALGMARASADVNCVGTHGYAGQNSYDQCHGKFQWRGSLSNTCSFCVTCTGSSIHHSMRINHHNGETKCSQYKDASCKGFGCEKKSPWERTVGAICGIGLVTGKAGCECRPKCGNMYEYIDGTCRSKSTQHKDQTTCTCNNGTAKTSGCYSHADSCATCNAGFFRHRVSTSTSTGWECIPMTTHGNRHRHNNIEHKCSGDQQYQTASGNCLTCNAGSYTHGGTKGERTMCSECPAGSSCDGSSTVTRCPAGKFAAKGARMCGTCSGSFYSKAGASQCSQCAGGYLPNGSSGRCVRCPPGYSCDGATKTLCLAGTAGINGACVPCNQGNEYSSRDGATACKTCPAGASCDGKTETPCAAGTFAPSSGMSNCLACAAHMHVTGGRKKCEPCPSGHRCDGNNKVVRPQGYRSDNGACHICPAGTFGDRHNCHACPGGHSSQEGAASCGECPAGSYIAADAQCQTCPAGYHCDGAGKYPCTEGTAAGAGKSTCTKGAAGHVSGAMAASCTACPAGTIAKRAHCATCPAGYECDGTNQVACLAGYYAAGGASSCSPCGADNKYSGAAAAACKTCGEGFFTHGGQVGTRTHCDGCSFNVNKASGSLTWLGWNEQGRKHAHCTADCDNNNDCASGSTCQKNLSEAQLHQMGCQGSKYSSPSADYCVAGTPPKAASDVGYICDGTSVKSKCDETKSYHHQVGTCVPTNGDERHPYSKDFARCLAKKTEAACSPNNAEASPFTGHVNTGCSWLQRDVHVTLYSNPRCVPTVRSTDIMSGISGCPKCAVNGQAYVETTQAAGWTDPGAVCEDSNGVQLSYTTSSIPVEATENGQRLAKGTHVLTYVVVDT